MAQSTINRARSAPRAKTEEDRPGTRQHLLEAVGHLFADKGFERSTAKEIANVRAPIPLHQLLFRRHRSPLCRRARRSAQPYFIGARDQLAVEGKTEPRAKLQAALDVRSNAAWSCVLIVGTAGLRQRHGHAIAYDLCREGKTIAPASKNFTRVHRRLHGVAGGRSSRRPWMSERNGAYLHFDCWRSSHDEARTA